jgi:hypothetical protein
MAGSRQAWSFEGRSTSKETERPPCGVSSGLGVERTFVPGHNTDNVNDASPLPNRPLRLSPSPAGSAPVNFAALATVNDGLGCVEECTMAVAATPPTCPRNPHCDGHQDDARRGQESVCGEPDDEGCLGSSCCRSAGGPGRHPRSKCERHHRQEAPGQRAPVHRRDSGHERGSMGEH